MVNSMQHPPCTEHDIRNAIDIYGVMQRTVKGSTTKARSAEASKEVPPSHIDEPQVLELDIAFIKGRMFLVGLLCPLDLCMVRPLLGGKGANELVDQIEHMRQTGVSRGFPATEIRCDNEAGIRDGDTVRYLQSKGIPIEFVGAGAHCPRVERRIRWLKEKFPDRVGSDSGSTVYESTTHSIFNNQCITTGQVLASKIQLQTRWKNIIWGVLASDKCRYR
jgi:hypothetical protein